MARHKQQSARNAAQPQPARHVNFPAGDYEIVDPVWLLKAGAIVLAAAALLAYASVCVYIHYGAWQTLLRPAAAIAATPSEPYSAVQFDAAETGTPRLTGWWIPAPGAPDAAAAAPTLLFLHSGEGSLGTNTPELDNLHQAGVNIFAIDYRGYGQSQGLHPSESSMAQDSSAALNYLLDTRHLRAATVVPYGVGVGAVLAAQLTRDHADLPAEVIDNPWPAAAEQVIHDPHYRLLPIALLLPDRFNLDPPLHNSTKPKLLISGGPGAAESRHAIPSSHPDAYTAAESLNAYFRSVADPKLIVSGLPAQVNPKSADPGPRPGGESDVRLNQALARFLDEYLAAARRSGLDSPGT